MICSSKWMSIFEGFITSHMGDYTVNVAHPARISAAASIESESAQKVRNIYRELGGVLGNKDIIYDGTWMTSGRTSHLGVGCIIELYSGLALDHCVLPNYYHGCAVIPKPYDDCYSEWLTSHKSQCQKHTDANAGQMEVIAAGKYTVCLSLHAVLP